ncbi:hypothetical protein Hypma_005323 [Hypsizygus marmoreus]|uniref:Uncharacterized protein n=1 Tax=Hypsizygus marmoreus TaxID=39966 RepID=A0A369K015_HYPMA|nr:hypothetical protein Hypma_005323 [Hypsizygus marmoreus]
MCLALISNATRIPSFSRNEFVPEAGTGFCLLSVDIIKPFEPFEPFTSAVVLLVKPQSRSEA